jgi:hypothetical protein
MRISELKRTAAAAYAIGQSVKQKQLFAMALCAKAKL